MYYIIGLGTSNYLVTMVTVYGKTRPKSAGKIRRKRGKGEKLNKMFFFFF
jgi:hypothetical protein